MEATAYVMQQVCLPKVGADRSSVLQEIPIPRSETESASLASDTFLGDSEHEGVGRANGRPRSKLGSALVLEKEAESLLIDNNVAQDNNRSGIATVSKAVASSQLPGNNSTRQYSRANPEVRAQRNEGCEMDMQLHENRQRYHALNGVLCSGSLRYSTFAGCI